MPGYHDRHLTLNLTDLRGNVIEMVSLTSDATVTRYSETTEFGLLRSASTESTVAPVYGWLGTTRRPTTTSRVS